MRSKMLRESCTSGYLWITSSNPNSARRRSSSHGSPQLRSSGSFKFLCLVFFALGILGFTLCIRAFPILPRASRLRPSAPTNFALPYFGLPPIPSCWKRPPFRSFSAETLIQKFFHSGTSPPSPFSPIFHAKLPHNPEGCVIEFTRIGRASQPSDSIGKLRSKIWR